MRLPVLALAAALSLAPSFAAPPLLGKPDFPRWTQEARPADRFDAGFFMCPSWAATKDEKDVTRGRVRVLQELANGSLIKDWDSPEVMESLDLCLSCKACSRDCPTGVDVARYRSEGLHRAYRGKVRPRTHYTLGNLPFLAGAVTKVPLVAAIANAHDFGTYRTLWIVSLVAVLPPSARRWLNGLDVPSSWISAGFPPPVTYAGSGFPCVRPFAEVIAGAFQITRPRDDGSIFPPANAVLHRNLEATYGPMLAARGAVSYTHLRAHETVLDLVCRLLLEKKKRKKKKKKKKKTQNVNPQQNSQRTEIMTTPDTTT